MPLILGSIIADIFVLLKVRGQQENWRSLLANVSLFMFGNELALGTAGVLTLIWGLGLIVPGRADARAVCSVSETSHSGLSKGQA